MTFENRKWVILDKNEVSSIDFSKVLESSLSILRYKIDGSQTFVKFEGDSASFLNGKTQYNHSQILEILNDPDNGWVEES